jgi:hypothetical protein
MITKKIYELSTGCGDLEGNKKVVEEKQAISHIQRSIDLITAVLLLTGQFTITGVFVTSGAFQITAAGPLSGNERLQGKSGNKIANWIIDALDVILAILLIKDEINVVSTRVASARFAVTVSGPIFGDQKQGPAIPDLKKIADDFHLIASDHFDVNHKLLRDLQRGDNNGFNGYTDN